VAGSKIMNAERLTIVVPYRAREEHLVRFVPHTEAFLGHLKPRILVVRQSDDHLFNRGCLKNIGISLAGGDGGWLALHDVDMLPADLACDYSIPQNVRHLAGATEPYQYELPYPNYLGGVVLATPDALASANGYSNRYQGWGYEDDDLMVRFWIRGIPVQRTAGRYYSLPHPQSPGSGTNIELFLTTLNEAFRSGRNDGPIDHKEFRWTSPDDLRKRPRADLVVTRDGLTTLQYRLRSVEPLHKCLDFPVPIDPVHEMVSVELSS
jgi:N-terminal domain of galactosyltransferase/N-terminal region of glycosyl transferase group 7